MQFSDYQKGTARTAVYLEKCESPQKAIAYTSLGLAGEAGEVANKVKKLIRDPDNPPSYEDIGKEIGGVLWYCSELATNLGLDLGEIALRNLQILAGRKERGTLHGSGDDR